MGGRTNSLAMRRIGWIIQRMRAMARARGAAVYRAEAATSSSSFRMLVFTMLSARTKDDTTLKVVTRLFAIADTPEGVLAIGRPRLERVLYGIGFYREKARNLIGACQMLEGRGVPNTLEGLLALPGVGRKTANIVLARAFGRDTIGVDVHVHRISNRLGIVRTKKPEETERALMKAVPTRLMRTFNRDFVAFGQTVCRSSNPPCGDCPIRKLCWRVGVEGKEKAEKKRARK